MEPPTLNLPDEVTFMMQAGLARDSITVDVCDLNLKSLKDLACNFVDKKVCFYVFRNSIIHSF